MRHIHAPVPSALVSLALLAPACTGASAGDAAQLAAVCDTIDAINDVMNVEEDFPGAVEIMSQLPAIAPDEVSAPVQAFLDTGLTTDDEAYFSPEFQAAEQAYDAFAINSCAEEVLQVVGTDFSYAGIPASLDAGRVVVNLDNRSQDGELHELALVRRLDDTPAEAIFDTGDPGVTNLSWLEAALDHVEIVDFAFTLPGVNDDDAFIADLEPGEYLIVCMLPTGSAEHLERYLMGEDVAVPTHFVQGMRAAFTVT